MKPPAHIRELTRLWRLVNDAATPMHGRAYDGAPQRHRSEHPTPGESTAQARHWLQWTDHQIASLVRGLRARMDLPVEDHGRCGGCGRPIGAGRLRRWTALDAASAELQAVLAHGHPVPARDVIGSVVGAVECSEGTVREAARRVGVVRRGGDWVWPLGEGKVSGRV